MTKINDIGFRTPHSLEISETPIRNVLVIGSCLVSAFPNSIPGQWPGASADWIALNNVGELPEHPPRAVGDYDFQLIQLATRSFLRETEYINLKYNEPDAWEALFDQVATRLEFLLEQTLRYNREYGLLTFVANTLVPQINPHGRLLHRGDHRNFCFFFQELNRRIDSIAARHSNVFILDVDQIASSLGKRYICDDAMWSIAHNSVYSSADDLLDHSRLQAPPRMEDKFLNKSWEFVLECLNELRTSFRTVRGIDAVKLVVTDLDDTLWRGVCGEWESSRYTDGWPTGYAEALALLAQRGVLLGVISKNDEATALKNWSSIIKPEAFTSIRINWTDKVSNMSEILSEVNLLPHNVLYLDDNPLERENMQKAFPGIRTSGEDPHLMRRLLLWSAELQLPTITRESATRSDMMKGQVLRNQAQRSLSREDFLNSLKIRIKAMPVLSVDAPEFDRCLELINKTNQFNTTGVRWTREELILKLSEGLKLFAFDCADRFTEYGITSVALTTENRILQMVMSCRIFGLNIEEAIICKLRDIAELHEQSIHASFCDTGKNSVALDNLKAIGFVETEGGLICTGKSLARSPAHICFA